MTKQDVIRIALSCFNISYDKIGDDSVEAGYCLNYIRSAELFCARSYTWSFLQKRYRFQDSDFVESEPFDKLWFCYKVPKDLIKVVFVNSNFNEDFRIIGTNFYTDKDKPEITYVSGEIDYESFPYPDDFGYMIAYRLAIEVAQFIVPNNVSISEQVQSKYMLIYQMLQKSEKDMQRRQNPSPKKYVY